MNLFRVADQRATTCSDTTDTISVGSTTAAVDETTTAITTTVDETTVATFSCENWNLPTWMDSTMPCPLQKL